MLTNVLLVKGFRHNLLSIGRLIEQTGINVIFTGNGYCFQDPYNSMMLGAGKRIEGLYYFVKHTENKQSKVVNKSDIVCQDSNCSIVANVVEETITDVNMLSLPHKTTTSVSQSRVGHKGSLDLLHARLGHICFFVKNETC